MKRWIFRMIVVTGLACASITVGGAETRIPDLDIGQGGHCVNDPQTMRLNHMKFLLQQRDATVREGVRGGRYSLAGCVDCHASKQNHSVLGTDRNFCQGCHVYAAVRIDCFECHSSRPRAFAHAQSGLPVRRESSR